MTLKFIGISTGRAGSSYISYVMNQSGIPNLHETHFIADNYINNKPKPWKYNEVGEWSAQAIPLLEKKLVDVENIWYQTRHPLKTIGSLLTWPLFDINAQSVNVLFFRDFFSIYPDKVKNEKEFKKMKHINKVIKYYIDCSNLCDSLCSLRWQVENVNKELIENLASILNINPMNIEKSLTASKNINTRNRRIELEWNDIPIQMKKELFSIAQRYGYETPR